MVGRAERSVESLKFGNQPQVDGQILETLRTRVRCRRSWLVN